MNPLSDTTRTTNSIANGRHAATISLLFASFIGKIETGTAADYMNFGLSRSSSKVIGASLKDLELANCFVLGDEMVGALSYAEASRLKQQGNMTFYGLQKLII